jgi:hypothetical protein
VVLRVCVLVASSSCCGRWGTTGTQPAWFVTTNAAVGTQLRKPHVLLVQRHAPDLASATLHLIGCGCCTTGMCLTVPCTPVVLVWASSMWHSTRCRRCV